ncbi:heavy-metal-associated domain-containing protein [Brevibacterium sp. JNUCC-42]|nr:heavy-metal-associated domain-containing protein [Brevibacterium sp. JNUCC-42]
MTKTVFYVEGMSCKSCVAKVEKALNTIGNLSLKRAIAIQ